MGGSSRVRDQPGLRPSRCGWGLAGKAGHTGPMSARVGPSGGRLALWWVAGTTEGAAGFPPSARSRALRADPHRRGWAHGPCLNGRPRRITRSRPAPAMTARSAANECDFGQPQQAVSLTQISRRRCGRLSVPQFRFSLRALRGESVSWSDVVVSGCCCGAVIDRPNGC